MNRYEKAMAHLTDGGHLLIDGGMGTEIELRGVPMVKNGWNGGGALTHPDIVRGVHEDYLRTGAKMIISNTFSTSRHVLRDADLEAHFEFLNRRGVELAIEARANLQQDDVLVAGGITVLSFTGRSLSNDELQKNIDDQAQIMADAGADLIMLEMMVAVEHAKIGIAAAKKAGLPVWVGLSCHEDENGVMCLNRGEPLVEAMAALKDDDFPLLFMMHTQVHFIPACLDIVQAHWSKPIGVYAHSGRFESPNWIFNDVISPGDYAEAAVSWQARGVQVIGGCCGIGVKHMQVVRERFDPS